METEEINVIALNIDKVHFYYECPRCWSKYKKNEEPYKNSKHKIHIHGSGNDFSNRIEHRISHCFKNNYNAIIHITDETIRL
jgi:hypothetical protein